MKIVFKEPEISIDVCIEMDDNGYMTHVGEIKGSDDYYYFEPDGEVDDDRLELAGCHVGYDNLKKLQAVITEYYNALYSEEPLSFQ